MDVTIVRVCFSSQQGDVGLAHKTADGVFSESKKKKCGRSNKGHAGKPSMLIFFKFWGNCTSREARREGGGASFPASFCVGMLSSSETFDLRVPRSAAIVETTKSVPNDLDDL